MEHCVSSMYVAVSNYVVAYNLLSPNFFMPDCDGGSFAGDAADPVLYLGLFNLYFRGHRIFHSIIDELVKDHGLANAQQVVLYGCSAGALAVYLNAGMLFFLSVSVVMCAACLYSLADIRRSDCHAPCTFSLCKHTLSLAPLGLSLSLCLSPYIFRRPPCTPPEFY